MQNCERHGVISQSWELGDLAPRSLGQKVSAMSAIHAFPPCSSHVLFPSGGSLISLRWISAGTRVSCIAGRFLTIWATREAPFVTSLAIEYSDRDSLGLPRLGLKKSWRFHGYKSLVCLTLSCFPSIPNSRAVRSPSHVERPYGVILVDNTAGLPVNSQHQLQASQVGCLRPHGPLAPSSTCPHLTAVMWQIPDELYPAEPSKSTGLWRIIINCYFKPLNFGLVCYACNDR